MSLIERRECPACGGDQAQERARQPYDSDAMRRYLTDYYEERGGHVDWELLSGDFVIDECSLCGALYQRYVPDEQLADELYERWIDPQHSLEYERTKETAALISLQLVDLLRLVDRPASKARVVDYGMGWGTWAGVAAAMGCQASGVELSASRRAHATSVGVDAVAIEDIGPASVDVVNAEQVFEHLPDPLVTTRQIREVLRPGGVLRVGVPSAVGVGDLLAALDWTVPKGTRGSLHALHPLEHLNCLPQRALERLGSEAGLEVVRRSPADMIKIAPLYAGRAGVRHALASVYRSIRRQSSVVWFRRP